MHLASEQHRTILPHPVYPGLVVLCSKARVDATGPAHWEVQRRLCWFVGSLFMSMPKPPPVLCMHSWTIMTPFYSEDLLYAPPHKLLPSLAPATRSARPRI